MNYFLRVLFLVFSFSTCIHTPIFAAVGESENDRFRLVGVEVVEKDVLEVEFSRELSADAGVFLEFIVEESQSSEEISVLLSEVNKDIPTKVLLMLESELKEGTDYTLTALDVKDVDGNTIESGIDAFLNFNAGVFTITDPITPPVIPQEENSDLLNEPISDVPQYETIFDVPQEEYENDLSLESGGPSVQIPEASAVSQTSQIGGETISQSATSDYTTEIASENTRLPQTGPEIIIIVLLALLGAGGYFFLKNRKIS